MARDLTQPPAQSSPPPCSPYQETARFPLSLLLSTSFFRNQAPSTWSRIQLCFSACPLWRSRHPAGTGCPANIWHTGPKSCATQRALLGTLWSSASTVPRFLCKSRILSLLCSCLDVLSLVPWGTQVPPRIIQSMMWAHGQSTASFRLSPSIAGALTVCQVLCKVLERLLQSRQIRFPPSWSCFKNLMAF